MANTLEDGTYTVVYPKFDTHRTLKVETVKNGNLKGRVIVSYLVGSDNTKDFRGFGFVDVTTGLVSFWSKFRAYEAPEKLERMQYAVRTIFNNPQEAGYAYALRSSCCYRCNRKLTVPASLNRGLGPECAKKVAAASSAAVVPEAAKAAPAFRKPVHAAAYGLQAPISNTYYGYDEALGF